MVNNLRVACDLEQNNITIMKKFCQLQRLKTQHGLDGALQEETVIRGGATFEMNKATYEQILKFCRRSTPELRANHELPHPRDAKVMFDSAKEIRSLDCGRGKKVTPKEPNNMIEYVGDDGEARYAQVVDIIELMGHRWGGAVIIKVNSATQISHSQRLSAVFAKLNVVQVQLDRAEYINPSQVVGPLAHRKLAPGGFGSARLSYLIRPLGLLSEVAWPIDNDDMQIDP
ncbi:hypothetical protein PGTUg99_030772 [Puccinia graminis f. sp. tritici]|uniref:Uncharacterized protein n=1 Tax=Puccinia graminis f. sp. tritici TaxID=56615 RepID=A0A5B0PNJ4_PUCGR|nr:hypothetical protein PGTUg99_030772 [Puccinia graminis f. sp. tritici]